MADREDEELQMALRMSLQSSPPEAKRSKPREGAEESPEARNRRLQRELMASAAEKRIRATENKSPSLSPKVESPNKNVGPSGVPVSITEARRTAERKVRSGEALPPEVANELFSMVFGSGVSKGILAQWSNQGIRFSSDPDTCMGLVQHEGGPCGVLATIQAFVLKYLLFFPQELGHVSPNNPSQTLVKRGLARSSYAATDNFAHITDERKSRALVLSMVEILFSCGNGKSAVVSSLDVFSDHIKDGCEGDLKNEMITKALEGFSIESASDLQKVLRVSTYTSQAAAFDRLMTDLPVFESRMGAMLFLISALLSRGLESVQADRDDPSLPLVTAPFGHASQEIVNLLLCGQAVPNVFDGRMDLGGGMSLKGIANGVEIGFLTLLESLNFCKVGQYLKCPKWPIWVVGSESHYTVLFALDTSVQDENELESREAKIRRAFDAQDQSGGGGFISVEGFQLVIRETNIHFPPEKLDNLCNAGFIVWSEFWQALLELDKNSGGLKDPTGSLGKKQFDLFHFNGIAKSVVNTNAMAEGEIPLQRPRLCKLSVSVPPKWTQEEFLADVVPSSSGEVNQPAPPAQHAPLVDCIRTRWPRATCSWVGDDPSIV
ncbi:ubiquitin carboxyl-terminal hydrolase MINDY-3 [Dioscorea cayenensis subsp. rotundata]|uniref:ubiquitinyl hydrolase 1 n=1 Tax=Dioscorea cayennensis subsp. rotundata TaxID=55577 RepID=A0AB40BAR6_DIOCR|nr:ubiquitin carboxyl-terminal hydrolase MINDY-3 [Dioscorea cayenensis subsp. rotundata]XP_039124296.1 ubiquitin carboxyl-terminal hydrolase MINDY-3 [Dioscorea cayenensis subsp. rotundata]